MLAAEFQARFPALHVLVNNAGIHARRHRLSADGIELTLAVNHLAWFLLTNLLLDQLKAGAPSRVVNVASQAMAGSRGMGIRRAMPIALDLDDLQSERRFDSMEVYGRSKLAMVMCGYALARRLADTGVTVNALHPGLVATEIVDDVAPAFAKPFLGLVKRFLLTPEQGAEMAIFLASAPDVAAVTGKYFIKRRERRSPDLSYDLDLQERLWRASATLACLTEHVVAAGLPT